MSEVEIKEFQSYVIKNSKTHITGTALGNMVQGALWLIKFKNNKGLK